MFAPVLRCKDASAHTAVWCAINRKINAMGWDAIEESIDITAIILSNDVIYEVVEQYAHPVTEEL